MSSEYIIIFK